MDILANKGFITSIVAAISPFIYARLIRKETEVEFLPGISTKTVGAVMFLMSMILFYTAGALELSYQFSHRLPNTGIEQIYIQLYSFAYVAVLYSHCSSIGAKRGAWPVS